MATMNTPMETHQLVAALESPDVSVRLAAALRAGSRPLPDYVEALVGRCAVEPDFFVRDMLTWALIRNDQAAVTDLLPVSSRKEARDGWRRTWPRSSGAVGAMLV